MAYWHFVGKEQHHVEDDVTVVHEFELLYMEVHKHELGILLELWIWNWSFLKLFEYVVSLIFVIVMSTLYCRS
jgi:hypothetical protein